MNAKRVSFYLGTEQVIRKLKKAGRAIGLFNAIDKHGGALLPNTWESPLLDSIREAALTTAIVSCYSLIDDKHSVTLNTLIQVGAEIEFPKRTPYLSDRLRVILAAQLAPLSALREGVIRDLRNKEEGHTSNVYAPHLVHDEQKKAEKDIEPIYNGCVAIINEILKERGWETFCDKFEDEIVGDLEQLKRVVQD